VKHTRTQTGNDSRSPAASTARTISANDGCWSSWRQSCGMVVKARGMWNPQCIHNLLPCIPPSIALYVNLETGLNDSAHTFQPSCILPLYEANKLHWTLLPVYLQPESWNTHGSGHLMIGNPKVKLSPFWGGGTAPDLSPLVRVQL